MGGAGYTRLALREKTTSITPANIHFLDNGFLPLATSRKVCDAGIAKLIRPVLADRRSA